MLKRNYKLINFLDIFDFLLSTNLFYVLKRNNSLDYLIDCKKLDNEQILIDSRVDDIVDKRLLSKEISDLLNKANLTDNERIVIVLDMVFIEKLLKN